MRALSALCCVSCWVCLGRDGSAVAAVFPELHCLLGGGSLEPPPSRILFRQVLQFTLGHCVYIGHLVILLVTVTNTWPPKEGAILSHSLCWWRRHTVGAITIFQNGSTNRGSTVQTHKHVGDTPH